MSGGLRRTRSRTTVFYLLHFQLLHFIAVGRTGLSTQVSRDMWLYVKTLLYPGSKGCGRPALTSGTMLSAHQPLQTPHFLCVHLVAPCLCAMAMKCSRVRPSDLILTEVGVHQSMTRKPPIHQGHLPAAVGTTVSVNTPFSLRSPSCPVPVCNGNEVFARPAFGLDMRSGVTTMGVQQAMPRKPPTHQRHLPAAVKYQDLEKRKRERRKARREDGRATDAK